ncbi:hypothetical protein TCON_1225 [Astathelohania contejeani]|uniref:Peptidase M48 domain-containing protein n=1 Tax=Astathelohania contejeani TaxID=164912 RepID=A0ABQ7HZI7_9MICR|nr:hypothetical protein TCON_1225 [Thelohania contejeani]
MNKIIKYSFIGFFGMTLFIISYELINMVSFKRHLSNGGLGIPSESHTHALASADPEEFIASQKYATNKRIFSVSIDLLANTSYIVISLLFLYLPFQKASLNLAKKRITIIGQEFRDLKRIEINYLCFLGGLYAIVSLTVNILRAKEMSIVNIISYFMIYFFIYLFIAPFVLLIVYILLTKFQKKFIFACYLAYIIKLLPDLLIHDKVDLTKMELMDINEFPEEIQNVLSKYKLENKVYKEKTPGKDLNAALIGYGSGMRMEIYGDYKNFTSGNLYSVFLHEIGHAEEKSLLRKSIIYFTLLFLEMALILLIYERLAIKFTNSDISYFTAFLVLTFIYRILLRQWLFALYKMGSQMSEINSDLFTIQFNYHEELANTLYNIGLKSRDYMSPTVLYNVLRSTHPSLFSRIEYLTSSR